ncbi:unnamed protein product [Porites evermanni]|uniref:Uncharacterized protein n=1 Tax=Porites evermanni TaxID=104178 RepID=A0ABN8S8A8_9CNID|nr:unnamed protein product [Porites evermanni]
MGTHKFMSLRGLHSKEELPHGMHSRKRAHLKSEIIYNWEKNMHDGSDKPTLRKKENKKATSFLSWIGFRDKKLEWIKETREKALTSAFVIPTIIITKAVTEIDV